MKTFIIYPCGVHCTRCTTKGTVNIISSESQFGREYQIYKCLCLIKGSLENTKTVPLNMKMYCQHRLLKNLLLH